jgi:hypothetical protein
MSIIPNFYQLNAEVECPNFVVNPSPTLHVSLIALKGRVVMVFFMEHPHMNQPLQMFYQILNLVNQKKGHQSGN